MATHSFTTILMPDGDGYQVIVPHYPEVTTWGKTPAEAFEMARECLELVLEEYAATHREQVLRESDAGHVVVGSVEVDVPDALMEEVRAAAEGVGAVNGGGYRA